MESENEFGKEFSDEGFWDKAKKFSKAAGKEVIEKALLSYYALQSPDTPAWAKTVIVSALGYFISPVDAIPDVIPMIGYADDLGVLTGALAMIAMSVTDEVKGKAKSKLTDWFGD